MTQEQTEKYKKNLPPAGMFSSQFIVALFLLPIQQKYSMLKDYRTKVKLQYDSLECEKEKALIVEKLEWLDFALTLVEKEEIRRSENRRYEPLEIPNVVPTPTEQVNENLQSRLNTIDKYFNKNN